MESKNKKKDISDLLLINPLWTKQPPLPRNLFELGSFLIDKGFNPNLCDLNVILSELKSDYIKKSIEIIKSYKLKILCFALSVNTAPFIFELINKIKKDRGFITIVGGLFTTSNPKLVFDNCDVDYVVIGEGFKALKTILELSKKGVYKFGGEDIISRDFSKTIKIGNVAPTIIRFNPKNFQKLSDLEYYTKKGYWGTYLSRGCNNNCKYCSSGILWKCSRYREILDVLNEINYIKSKYSIKKFQFFDDCFTNNKKFIFEFLTHLKKLGVSWICNARIDELSFKLIQLMANSGCKKIYHGIEHPSKQVRERLGKQINLDEEEILEILKFEKEVGIEPTCSFLCAFPGERKSDLSKTLEFIHLLKKLKISTQLNLFIPFNGIELSKNCNYRTIDKIKEFKKSDIFIDNQFEIYAELINKYKEANPENKLCLTNIDLDTYKKVMGESHRL